MFLLVEAAFLGEDPPGRISSLSTHGGMLHEGVTFQRLQLDVRIVSLSPGLRPMVFWHSCARKAAVFWQ